MTTAEGRIPPEGDEPLNAVKSMKPWLLLAGAIVMEVPATLALRATVDHPAWVSLGDRRIRRRLCLPGTGAARRHDPLTRYWWVRVSKLAGQPHQNPPQPGLLGEVRADALLQVAVRDAVAGPAMIV